MMLPWWRIWNYRTYFGIAMTKGYRGQVVSCASRFAYSLPKG